MKFESNRKTVSGAAVLAGGMMFAGSASANVIFSEDFEGVTLQEYTSASENAPNTGTEHWSPDLPAGWTRDNTTTLAMGPVEFFGWTVHNKEAWIETAGNQSRDTFTGGIGNVLVADGDEYDDLGDIDPNFFNVFAQTPVIDLTGVDQSKLQLSFDSSFRAYPTQIGTVDVSFDGGTTFSNILTIDSSQLGFSEFADPVETFDANELNPTGTDMVVRFGVTEAGNDWWWAVDNVQVTEVPEPSSLALLGLGGLAMLRRRK